VVSTEDRREISVLFVDLVDFTPYAERSDPELIRAMQHEFFATVRRIVSQHGGVVEKYIGDAVMAVFGAPVVTETDPLRCVRAGLELQRALARQRPGSGLSFRIGVATGEALVDLAAARDGGQAIVAGDVVNTAARIQSVAPPDGVLVCGRTHARTADAIRYQAQPPMILRGRSTPTELWLAVAPVPRQQGRPDPDPTPLVERQHELELLSGALRRALMDRTPQLVTLYGQAGIGKSRLVRELHRRLEALGVDTPVVWHTGHCRPFGENVTYAGLADIVRAEAGILETDPTTTAERRLRDAVHQLVPGPDGDRLAEALAPLVGLPGPVLPAEEAASAWRRFLVALANRHSTVLVFEDLHWADEPMLRFIELLAASAQNVPLLVLTTARPELIHRYPGWPGTIAGSVTITLPPLRPDAMATLYRHMLGESQVALETLQPLVELADGIPLYAQEYVRMLAERRTMLPADPQAAPLPMPDNVHAVIANRVDLLEPADRAVLQAAAVVGMAFWPGAVASALTQPIGLVEASLRRLAQREFIVEQPESIMAGEREFRFRHVLVRDVCYQRLPRRERAARHERTADWLEAQSPRQGTDLAEVLAHHRWTAHKIAQSLNLPVQTYAEAARRALYLAARRAYALHALDAARTHVARAISLLPATEDTTPAAEHERLRLELFAAELDFYRDRSTFLAADGAARLRRLAEQLTAGAADPGRTGDAARAWTLVGQAAWLRTDREEALAALGRAVALFEPLPDSAEKVDAYAELGRLHMLNYECEPAIAAAGTAAAIAARLGLVEALASARITTATARYESGDPSGLAELREVTAQCRRDRLLMLTRATRNLAHLVREEGDWQQSEELLAESRRLDGPGGHNILADYAGEAMRAYFTGDLETLARVDEQLVSLWKEGRDLRAYARALREEPAADADAAAALADARASGFHRPLWAALAGAALCHALRRRPDQAAELLAELIGEWGKVAVLPSGEWVCKAAAAAALTGPEPAEALRVPLTELRHHTRWSRAALHTVTATVALADGYPAWAGAAYLAAARIHAQTPAVTDRMMALALSAAAFGHAGRPGLAAPAHHQVQAFAVQAGAPGLLRIARGELGYRPPY